MSDPWDVVSPVDPWQVVEPNTTNPPISKADLYLMAAKAQAKGMLGAAKNIGDVVLPKKEQLPEIGGMTAAQMAAQGLPLGIGTVASGAGAMGGEIAKQVGEAITGNNPPTTFGEALKRNAGAFARGATAGLVGRGIEKAFAPAAESVTPEIQAQMEAAKRAGVEPPLSATTTSPGVQKLERMVEYGPFGAQVTARKNAALGQLQDFADKISGSMAADKTPEEVAATATGKISAFKDALDSAKNKLYDVVWPVLKDQKPQLDNTISTLEDIVSRRSGELEPQQLSMLKGLLKRVKAVPEQLQETFNQGIMPEKIVTKVPGKESSISTVEQLRNTKTNIGQMVKEGFNDPGLTGIKTELTRLYGAISSDIDATATAVSPEVGQGLALAESTYKKGIEKLQQPLIDAIQNRVKTNPSSIFEAVVKNDNPTLVQSGKEILGKDGFDVIRKQWFDDLVKNSMRIIDGTEQISPGALANNLRRMGSTLPEMVSDSPELAQKIADLKDVSTMLTRGGKVTGGSQTAFINRAASVLKEARDLILAPLVRTEVGRQYLTTGFLPQGIWAGRVASAEAERGLQAVTK